MLKNEILTTKEEISSVAKDVFYEMEDMDAYNPVTFKVNEDLKSFLENLGSRDGIDKQFIIPDSAH